MMQNLNELTVGKAMLNIGAIKLDLYIDYLVEAKPVRLPELYKYAYDVFIDWFMLGEEHKALELKSYHPELRYSLNEAKRNHISFKYIDGYSSVGEFRNHWREYCQELSDLIGFTAANYDSYVERINRLIDSSLSKLPEKYREIAVDTARQFDYQTLFEREFDDDCSIGFDEAC